MPTKPYLDAASITEAVGAQEALANVTLLGGSNAAGGLAAPVLQYANQVSAELAPHGIRVVPMGQGNTDTMWAAAMFSSLVDPLAKAVVWEFALNDIGEWQNGAWQIKIGQQEAKARPPGRHARSNAGSDADQARSTRLTDTQAFAEHARFMMDLFLLQAELHPSRPSLVFVYTWDWPSVMPPFTLARSAFQAQHTRVIGSPQTAAIVDAAAFVERLCKQLRPDACRRDMFMKDSAHFSEVVHTRIAAELSHELLKHVLRTVDHKPTKGKAARQEWPCSRSSPAAANVWSHVLARRVRSLSWTGDQPTLPKQGLSLTMPASTVPMFVPRGSRRTWRLDAKRSLLVPRCGSGMHTFRPNVACPRPRGLTWHGNGVLHWSASASVEMRLRPAIFTGKCQIMGTDFTRWVLFEDAAADSDGKLVLHVCHPHRSPESVGGPDARAQVDEATASASTADVLFWVALFCEEAIDAM